MTLRTNETLLNDTKINDIFILTMMDKITLLNYVSAVGTDLSCHSYQKSGIWFYNAVFFMLEALLLCNYFVDIMLRLRNP